jgi:DNA replication protein DnaC
LLIVSPVHGHHGRHQADNPLIPLSRFSEPPLLATALAVEAVRAGKSVHFIPLADLVAALAKAEREGTLREKIRTLCRPSLLVVDEIGYLPVTSGGGNLFFQLVNARYEKGVSSESKF